MSFTESIRTVFRKYATFSGRARRSEFWWFVLFCAVVSAVLSSIPPYTYALSDDTRDGSWWSTLFQLATLVPSLAVTARRLHDTGRSGWWQLLWIVPIIGWIMMLIWTISDSHPGPNQHGPNPKDPQPAFGGYPGGYDPYASQAPYGTQPQAPGYPQQGAYPPPNQYPEPQQPQYPQYPGPQGGSGYGGPEGFPRQ